LRLRASHAIVPNCPPREVELVTERSVQHSTDIPPMDAAPDVVTVSYGLELRNGVTEFFSTEEEARKVAIEAGLEETPLVRVEERRTWLI